MSTVMVVDDEADTRYLVRQILERNGFNVVEAVDGEQCLEMMRFMKPDMVLLDIMMPGLDGWEVLGEIQGDVSLSSVPVTMFTVTTLTPSTLRKKEAEGLVNYIVKPFSNEGLVKSVSDTLKSIEALKAKHAGLARIDLKLADELEHVSRLLILHKNFLSFFKSVLRQRKEDGSMDDIQSFEDVISSESVLINSYEKRLKEIEGLAGRKSAKG